MRVGMVDSSVHSTFMKMDWLNIMLIIEMVIKLMVSLMIDMV